MFTHEDKRDLDSTAHGGKLAGKGKKRAKKHTNKKADKFRKAQLKRG